MKLESGEATAGRRHPAQVDGKTGGDDEQQAGVSQRVFLEVLREVSVTPKRQDSFLVCHPGTIRKAFQAWSGAFPHIKPSFELLWHSGAEVLRLLLSLGVRHFRCRNREEVRAALAAGLPPEALTFAPSAAPAVASHLKFASANGVGVFAFQGEADLRKIALKAPGARTLLTLRPATTTASFQELAQLLETARSLGLEVVGVAVREEDADDAFICKAIPTAKMVFDISRNEGYDNMTILDLGQVTSTTKETSALITDCLMKQFGPQLLSRMDVVASWRDGGLVADSAALCARVIGKRAYEDADGRAAFTYVLNDGIFGSFSRLLLDDGGGERLDVRPLADHGGARSHPTEIWGCSGDDLDVLGRNLLLPEVANGDWLVFSRMGAGVTNTAASCAFAVTDVLTSKGNKFWVIDRMERQLLSSRVPSVGCGRSDPIASAPSILLEELLHDMTSIRGEI